MKLTQKKDDPIEIDMSPMIDMVFLLLIFFIVASAVIKVDPVAIAIPKAIYAKVPEDETGRYKITVTVDGVLYAGPLAEEVDAEGLKEKLAPLIEEDEKLKILIRSDMGTKYEYTEGVLTACAEVGATDMIFAAFEEAGPADNQ